NRTLQCRSRWQGGCRRRRQDAVRNSCRTRDTFRSRSAAWQTSCTCWRSTLERADANETAIRQERDGFRSVVEHGLAHQHVEVAKKLVESLVRHVLFGNHITHRLHEFFGDVTLQERRALGLLVQQLVPVLRGIFHYAIVFAVVDHVHVWPIPARSAAISVPNGPRPPPAS